MQDYFQSLLDDAPLVVERLLKSNNSTIRYTVPSPLIPLMEKTLTTLVNAHQGFQKLHQQFSQINEMLECEYQVTIGRYITTATITKVTPNDTLRETIGSHYTKRMQKELGPVWDGVPQKTMTWGSDPGEVTFRLQLFTSLWSEMTDWVVQLLTSVTYPGFTVSVVVNGIDLDVMIAETNEQAVLRNKVVAEAVELFMQSKKITL